MEKKYILLNLSSKILFSLIQTNKVINNFNNNNNNNNNNSNILNLKILKNNNKIQKKLIAILVIYSPNV